MTWGLWGLDLTASRTAMPAQDWYHASPHELPVGTTLTPGGGESAFASLYRDHLGPELQNHVWLADSRNIAGWVDRGDGSGPRTKHVYRVEPNDAPRLYSEDDPHMGWVVPSARIVEKIPTHAVPPYDPFDDDDHHTASRTAMPWYHVSPHDLPVGTRLVPGGGDSPLGFDNDYDDPSSGYSAGSRSHVWVAPDTSWASEYVSYGPDDHDFQNPINPFIYEVEPEREPRPVGAENDLNPGGQGWITPGAVIKRVHQKGGRPHAAFRTAMPWYHSTDAELNPGDELLPAAERGHPSKWTQSPDYDPHSVYFNQQDNDDEADDDFGNNRYEVEPIGPISRDPEYHRTKKEYLDEYGHEYEGEVPEEDIPGASAYTAPRARVVRKLPVAPWQYNHPEHPNNQPGHPKYVASKQLSPEEIAEWNSVGGLFNPQNRPYKESRIMTAAVTVYTRPSCPQCMATKKHLDKLGIDHDTVDVTQDPEAHAYVTGLGYASAPVVVVNDGEDHWSGYRPDRLKGLAE